MTEEKRIMGKKARASGQRFELRVRDDLRSKGWIVSKWGNNVNDNKLITSKPSRFKLGLTGFPDFICYKEDITNHPSVWKKYTNKKNYISYEVIGVEVKSNGYLDKIEKEKCKWLLDNKIFSKILIASKGKKRGEIEYKEFKINKG